MNANVGSFLRVLDPADNSTGGGTASAVAGAMAAALVGMVARLSVSKKRAGRESFFSVARAEAERLSDTLFGGGHQDAQAYDAVRAACRLPKHTEEQGVERRQAMQHALILAARVPLANAEGCRRVLELCALLDGRSNPNAASDLECARLLAHAGLLGCLANVEINLSSITDEDVKTELSKRADELREFARAGGSLDPVA
jgi:formiminotetrahydrofolate cyclodeaminase